MGQHRKQKKGRDYKHSALIEKGRIRQNPLKYSGTKNSKAKARKLTQKRIQKIAARGGQREPRIEQAPSFTPFVLAEEAPAESPAIEPENIPLPSSPDFIQSLMEEHGTEEVDFPRQVRARIMETPLPEIDEYERGVLEEGPSGGERRAMDIDVPVPSETLPPLPVDLMSPEGPPPWSLDEFLRANRLIQGGLSNIVVPKAKRQRMSAKKAPKAIGNVSRVMPSDRQRIRNVEMAPGDLIQRLYATKHARKAGELEWLYDPENRAEGGDYPRRSTDEAGNPGMTNPHAGY